MTTPTNVRRIVGALLALALAACAATPEPSYQWLSEAHTAELGARITAAGPTARLEVRDSAGLRFRVVVPGARLAPLADINDSHRCPPFCQ